MPTACVEIELAKLIARLALEGFALADVPNDVHDAEVMDMLTDLGHVSAVERARLRKVFGSGGRSPRAFKNRCGIFEFSIKLLLDSSATA